MFKKGQFGTPIDFIAGSLLVLAGVAVIMGSVNFGTVLGSVGLLIEAVRILMQQGF